MEDEPRFSPRAIASATALACLTFVLVLARVANVHLGADAAGIAVPLAACGFALGTLELHLRPTALERFVLARALAVLAASCIAALVIAFALFCWVLPPTSTSVNTEVIDETLTKVAIFVVLVGVPCAQAGRILAALQHQRTHAIASIHAAALFGAALACMLTPVAFHLGGLSLVVISLVVLCFVPLVLERRALRDRLIAAALMLIAALGAERFVDYADRNMSYESWGMLSSYRELDRVWNEHARLALVELDRSDRGDEPLHRVIVDNARVNVHINRYRNRSFDSKQLTAITAPWSLGRRPETVLMLGVGAWSQMTYVDQHAHRRARITAVEPDADIERLVRAADSLADYELEQFLAEDRIELVHDDPRHFLASLPEDARFDFIYVGVDAQTESYTRFAPAYLDTVEGYRALLDRLAPGGLLSFDHQPLDRRIPNLRRVFAEQGVDDVRGRMFVVDDTRASEDDLIVAPNGLGEDERMDVYAASRFVPREYRRRLRYLDDARRSMYSTKDPAYVELIEGELGETFDDDRPYVVDIDFEAWELSPPTTDKASKSAIATYVPWTKITAAVLVSGLALLIIGLSEVPRERRIPVPVLAFVLLFGACFMLCEAAIVARLGLFASQPPLGMAVAPALLLLAAAAGSALHPRLVARSDLRMLAALAAIAAGVLALGWFAGAVVGEPLALTLARAALMVAPLGFVLGLIYPELIGGLVVRGQGRLIPICLGLSVLAGVVALVFARVIVIELGASALLQLAAAGFGLALVAALVDRAWGRRQSS